MRVLLTGGTGFIGRNTLPTLLAQNHDVTLLVTEKYAAGTPLPPDIQAVREQISIVYADLRNNNLTHRAVTEANPDAILHLAVVGPTDPFLPVETAIRHNVNGTINLIRAAFEKNRVQKLIVARTPGEATAMNVYAASKAAAWNFCQMYARTAGWPIVGATIFQAYGQHQPPRTLIPSAFAAAAKHDDFPMTAGTQLRDWVAVQDVADALSTILTTKLPPATTLDIGTGTLTSIANIVQTIYNIVQSEGSPLVGALPSRAGESPRQIADTTKTRELTHWQSTISVQEGLDAYWQQIKHNFNKS